MPEPVFTGYYAERLIEGNRIFTIGKCYRVMKNGASNYIETDHITSKWLLSVNVPESILGREREGYWRFWKVSQSKVSVGDHILVNNPDNTSKIRGWDNTIKQVQKVSGIFYSVDEIRLVEKKECVKVERVSQNKTIEESVSNMKKFYAKRIGESTGTLTKGKMYEITQVSGSSNFVEILDGATITVKDDHGRTIPRKNDKSKQLFEIYVEENGVIALYTTIEDAVYVEVSPKRKAKVGDMVRINANKSGWIENGVVIGNVYEVAQVDDEGDIDRIMVNGVNLYTSSYAYYSEDDYVVVVKEVKTGTQDIWEEVAVKQLKKGMVVEALETVEGFEKGKKYIVRNDVGTSNRFDCYIDIEKRNGGSVTGWINRNKVKVIQPNMSAISLKELPMPETIKAGTFVRVNDDSYSDYNIHAGDILVIVGGSIVSARFDAWYNFRTNKEGYTSGWINSEHFTVVDFVAKNQSQLAKLAYDEVNRIQLLHSGYTFHFVVKADEGKVTCVRKANGRKTDPTGVAKCAPGEQFIEEVGKVIAMYRSMGMTPPQQFTGNTVVEADEHLKIGDKVVLVTRVCKRGYDSKVIVGKTEGTITDIRESGKIYVKFTTRDSDFATYADELAKVGSQQHVDLQQSVTKRPTVGDYVEVITKGDSSYTVGEIIKIVRDDNDGTPYKGERKNGSTGNFTKESWVKMSTETAFNAQKQSVRPKLGDIVKLLVDKEGLHKGDLATIDRDTQCSNPYVLKRNGNRYGYFDVSDVAVVTAEELAALTPNVGDKKQVEYSVLHIDGNVAKIKLFDIEMFVPTNTLRM